MKASSRQRQLPGNHWELYSDKQPVRELLSAMHARASHCVGKEYRWLVESGLETPAPVPFADFVARFHFSWLARSGCLRASWPGSRESTPKTLPPCPTRTWGRARGGGGRRQRAGDGGRRRRGRSGRRSSVPYVASSFVRDLVNTSHQSSVNGQTDQPQRTNEHKRVHRYTVLHKHRLSS